MSFIVRTSTTQDADRVSAVLAASYAILLRGAYDDDVLAATLPFMTRANPALLSSGAYYVAESEGRIVGSGGWSFNRPGSDETEAGLAHIRHFAVHPDWARRGVGRALYDACEVQARATGARRFECYATLSGERFYAALGFRTVGRIDVRMGEDIFLPSLLMERDIDPYDGNGE
jgi:predicted N-acetyltransferase YhbS